MSIVLVSQAQEVTPEPTAEVMPEALPTATPVPPAIPSDALPVLISARTDIELLAIAELGADRPTGWSGSLDVNDANLALLLRLDLELLVGRLYSLDARPQGWFGAVPGSPFSIARDIRHDLELLADTVIAPNVRPPGWAGDSPLMRCDRATQVLIDLIEGSGFVLTTDPLLPDYCQLAAIQASQFAENNSVAVPAAAAVSQSVSSDVPVVALPEGSTIRPSGDITFAFLNRYATERVGTIPEDETFVPVARSYRQFSNMTLVRGANFEVFVDYKTTTLTAGQFEALPNVNDAAANPTCEAEWCVEPFEVASIFAPGGSGSQQRTLVNAGTNIVIYYDGGDSGDTTLVRMELCPQATSVSRNGCQPVTTVLRNGVAVSSTGQAIDGIPQYRLPIRYSTTSARTQNFYTTELWIAPPENR
jgi:hypothetical protein